MTHGTRFSGCRWFKVDCKTSNQVQSERSVGNGIVHKTTPIVSILIRNTKHTSYKAEMFLVLCKKYTVNFAEIILHLRHCKSKSKPCCTFYSKSNVIWDCILCYFGVFCQISISEVRSLGKAWPAYVRPKGL